ncbi:MAG: aldo/keto reductase [Capsulimonadales bacterium]|nr:aldo/keto reductase [Capsulimonadales bacterium]
MNRRTIPNMDPEVSALCFGCGSLGTGAKGDTALRLIDDYVSVGGNFFDSAHCYAFWTPEGAGASERELGRCLRHLGIRDRCVVATKGGHPEGPGYPRPKDFLAETVLRQDIEDSLDRLGVDRIDLYFLHRDDGRTPVGEIIDRLNGEVARGRIGFLGASNWSVERIAAANTYAAETGQKGFVISQIQWGLAVPNWYSEEPGPDPVHRTVGLKEREFHRRTGLPIAAFSATVSGYFAGNEGANHLYDSEVNRRRRERAREVAGEIGATPNQVALAWLLHHPFSVFPIFATNRPDHLNEILGAAQVRLAEDQLGRLTVD